MMASDDVSEDDHDVYEDEDDVLNKTEAVQKLLCSSS
jgi:hypothetical protein